MPIELDTNKEFAGAKLKVLGVGGGGGNAINNMINTGLKGVGFIAANTDKQALDHNLASVKVQLGYELTNGLGAGADPNIGYKSVEESIEEVKDALKGSDMVFVTAGMGGGTGTGGAPMIASIAKETNALVVGIVTKPFKWEGRRRLKTAEEGIKKLRENVDALIVIPNQRLLEIIDKKTGFKEAFQKVDEVLYNATRGISDIIGCHGTVNVDFADVRTVMKGMGDALMGIGTASGDNRAIEATKNALNSPLLDGISISGSKGVLVNITGGKDLSMMEISEAVSIIEEEAGEDANIIHGVVENSDFDEEIMVTVVATGFNNQQEPAETTEKKPERQRLPFDKINESKNDLNKRSDKVAKVNGYNIGSGRFTRTEANKETADIYSNIDTIPRGLDELKKFDSPAFERRKKKGEEQKIEFTNNSHQ